MTKKIQTKAGRIIIALLLAMLAWAASSTSPVIAEESGVELVAPHIAYGDGWWTELAVLNIGESETLVTFYAYDNEGSQLENAKNITLPANQNYVKDVSELFSNTSPENIASMRVISHSSFLTGLLTYGKTNTTQLAGLPLLPATSSILYVPHVEVNNPWWTGIGVMNAGDSDTEISLSLFSNEGLIKTISKTLKTNQRLVGKISYNEFFGNYNYKQGRYMVIESADSQPISGMFIVSTDDDTTYMGDSMQVIPGSGSGPLSAPKNITATPGENGQVEISWDEVDGADHYILYYGASAGSANYMETVEGTSYTAKNLTGSTAYDVIVKAVKEGERSDYSFVTPPDEPVNIQAASGDGQSEISWDKVTGADYYNIYWADKTGVTKDNYDNKRNNISFADIPYTISNLENGVTYYLVVTAVSSGRESSESVEITFDGSNFPDNYINALGMDFQLINTGTFTMGSPVGEPGRGTDETQRQVTFAQPFYMQTTELTRKHWEELMGTDPSRSTCDGNADDCPVDSVSWENIQSFLIKLNDMETEEGVYRLPTEEEWEYAARAGTTTAFANGGITETECGIDSNLNSMGWYCGNAQQKMHPVRGKQANDWWLFDMHGNVWELCQDGSDLVIRGGCRGCYASQCRSAERAQFYSVSSIIGFRVAWFPDKPVPPTKPDAPEIYRADAKNREVLITWEEQAKANSYNIYYRINSAPDITNALYYNRVIKNITGSPYSVEGLTNGTKYYFVVTAVNSVGESAASEAKSATPAVVVVPIPEAPANVWAVPPTSGQVTISWDTVEEADAYNIYYATQAGVRKSNYSSLPGGTQKRSVSNPYTVTSLTNDRTYYFVVTAVNSAGESSESGQVSAKPVIMTSFTNSWDMKFIRIPAGTFMMGSPEDETGRNSDETLHQVILTKPFYMQAMEVTQENWEDITGDNPSWFRHYGITLPVESVKMTDIQMLINIMNARGDGVYRLPTEAEWEYAARAGASTAFANGDITAQECNYDTNLGAMGWYCGSSANKRPYIAGRKDPNKWGLHDMYGNVDELCQDGYTAYSEGTVSDPLVPLSADGYYVRRGGNYRSNAEDCRSAKRTKHRASSDAITVGLRLVLEKNP